MLEFFEHYSFNEIFLYTIMLLLTLKAAVEFVEWVKERYEKKFNKDHLALTKEKDLEEYYATCKKQYEQSVMQYKNLENKIDNFVNDVRHKVNKIENQLTQLTESDKHDIKGWIVEKHHHLIKKGWVDDFTMDTLERRYSDYVAEDGNSYIASLMEELRALPHFPSETEE